MPPDGALGNEVAPHASEAKDTSPPTAANPAAELIKAMETIVEIKKGETDHMLRVR